MLAVQTSLHELGPLDEEDRLVEARTRLARIRAEREEAHARAGKLQYILEMSRDVNAPDYVLARTTLPQALDRASILQTEMNDAAEALRTMRDLVLAERLDQVRPELRAKTTAVVRALQRVRAEEYQALTVYVAAAERALGGRHPLLTDALWPALINPDGTRSWLDEQIEYKQARGLLDP